METSNKQTSFIIKTSSWKIHYGLVTHEVELDWLVDAGVAMIC